MHCGLGINWSGLRVGRGVKLGFAVTADTPFAKLLGEGLPQTDIFCEECPYPLLNK